MNNVILRGYKSPGKLIGQGFARFSRSGIDVCQHVRVEAMVNYIGSGVTILAEVDETENTIVYLQSLIDPLGNEIEIEEVMEFDEDVASYTIQTTTEDYIPGRYKYVVRAENGTFSKISAGYFYMEEQFPESAEAAIVSAAPTGQAIYWGLSDDATLSTAQINALNTALATSRAQTRVLSPAGQYLYIVYPAAFGAATFTVNGLSNNDFTLVTQNHTPAGGSSTSYRVYKSNNLLTGTYSLGVL